MIHNEEANLMAILDESEEMNIFDTIALKEVIQYKWLNFAKSWHLIGAFFHLFYILSLSVYILEVYTLADGVKVTKENEVEELEDGAKETHNARHKWLYLLCCGVAYPLIYECIQLLKVGPGAYFGQFWNWTDMFFIWTSVANIVLHF